MQEELFDWAMVFAEGGYDVVLFEGPGQGAALREHGLVMRPDWERPVAAVLDHFAIERATLLGISLGGYLAPRAAAFEPRIERVVVCETNTLLEPAMRESPATGWAIRHGMRVAGAADAYEFLLWLREMNTAPFSDRVTQDVLLLAGTEDHIVPIHQLWRQSQNLRRARSLTTRVFTAAEQAHNHCQIGNIGLALDFVRSWLDFQTGHYS
jgi:pimeloyl-ACP methyl ester carboxylesterase